MKFEVTERACQRISELMEQANAKIGLRIAVDGGGCSGFMYNYDLVEKIEHNDFIWEKNNIKIVMDPLSKEFLEQCRLEFIEELGSAYFQISNPKATAKCGCGNSFSL